MAGPKYDTGLTRAQRTLLRAAIATNLADLLKANGGYLRALKSLPLPLRGTSDDDLGWIGEHALGQTPCILIALGRKDYDSVDVSDVWRGKIDVALYVCSSNLRGYIDGRLETDVVASADSTADPGIDTILEHAEERLLGQSFELGGLASQRTSDMRPSSEDEVFTNGEMTVWEQRYSIYVERQVNPDRAVAQNLLTIEGDHSIVDADPADLSATAVMPTTVATLEAPP